MESGWQLFECFADTRWAVFGREGIHVELVAVLDEQVKLNDVNRQLVESRLEYINFLIDTMGEETDGSNPYNSSGADARTREQRSRIIDQRV